MVNWRIYYGDGTMFSNEDGPPESAPCPRVICVAFYDEDGLRKICHRADYYIWDGKRWYSADINGFMQYMLEPGLKVVKFGREIGDLQYRAVMAKALNNDLPLSRSEQK